MRGSGSTLVGVAIAVALIPPAATSGLGIAFGFLGVAIAGAVLVVVNLLAINVSALVLFWVAGFKPLDAGQFEGVRASVVSRIVVIVIAIALLSIVLGAVTWTTFQTQSFEQQVQNDLQQRFDEADIEGVELVSVTVDYDAVDLLLGNEPQVNVLVGIPRDLEVPPDLAQRWDDELTAEFDREVIVRVGFIEAQVSDGRTPDQQTEVDSRSSATECAGLPGMGASSGMRSHRCHPLDLAENTIKKETRIGKSRSVQSS